MRIKTVALDLGMVVLNFSHRLACCRLSRLGGGAILVSEMYRRIFDSGLNAAMDRGMPLDEIVLKLRAAAEVEATSDEIIRAFADMFWVNSDVCEALPFIPPDVRLVLASNTNLAHATFFQREFAHVLGAFDDQVLSCNVQASKPSTEFYAHLVRTANCQPAEVLFFDDREDNIAGGMECGLMTVLYTPKTSFVGELARRGVVLSKVRTR